MTTGKKDFDVSLPGIASGLELAYPDRRMPPPYCLGHTPFALWLIGALGPRLVVQLGIHTGNFYCALLQAVDANRLDTRCFGIDHWETKDPAGYQSDDDIYNDLRFYHDTRYGTFSTLLQSRFDLALRHFTNGTIDLLYIDGSHTYEAVSADFASWLPKVSSHGVALVSNINVRDGGFGVWQLWEEISSRYPHFEFLHSQGLGMVYLGSEPLTDPLKELFASAGSKRELIQNYFARLGASVIDRLSSELTLKTPVGSLQADIRTSVMRHQMVVTARLQKQLVAAVADRHSFEQHLQKVLQSRSWRLTAPIRRATTELRRLLGRHSSREGKTGDSVMGGAENGHRRGMNLNRQLRRVMVQAETNLRKASSTIQDRDQKQAINEARQALKELLRKLDASSSIGA